MKILSPVFPGSIHFCIECHALLAYTPQDIYENHFIYCPLCKTKQECAMDLNYDGVVIDARDSKSN